MSKFMKVKILRLFRTESGAHIRARIKKELKLQAHKSRVANWFLQGNRGM